MALQSNVAEKEELPLETSDQKVTAGINPRPASLCPVGSKSRTQTLSVWTPTNFGTAVMIHDFRLR